MLWPGIEDEQAAIGTGMREVINASYDVHEELRRRPGWNEKFNASGFEVAQLPDQSLGTFYLFGDDSGDITSIKEDDGTATTLQSGLGTSAVNIQRGSFAKYGSRLYYANGFDAALVFESGTDTSPRQMGIDAPAGTIGAPSTGAAGDNTDGDHRYRYRYQDGNTDYISDPSIALEVTISGNTILTFTVGGGADIETPSASNVDTIRVEATVASGTRYFVAATVERNADGTWPASVDVDISDLALQEQPQLGAATGNAPPPLFDWIHEHRGRLFGIGADTVEVSDASPTSGSTTVTSAGNAFSTEWAGRLITFANATDPAKRYRVDTVTNSGTLDLTENFAGTSGAQTARVFSGNPDRLSWSGAGLPEGWDATTNARDVLQGESDVPSGLASFNTDLYIFGQRTMRRLMYDTDPGVGQLDRLPTDMGLWNQRCLVYAEGRMYGWGRAGAWVIQGILPRHFSRRIDTTVRSRADTSQLERFHGSFDPQERSITWFYVPTGESTPTEAICYDLHTDTWSLRQWDAGVDGSETVTDASGETWLLGADNNGYSWFAKPGFFDGVEDGEESVFTADSGATTTVVPVNETIQADAVGIMAYRVSDGTTRLVTANTGTTFTVTTAWDSTPAQGEEFYFGRIVTSFLSKWVPTPKPEDKKRPERLGFAFIPSDAGSEFNVYYYADFSDVSKPVSALATDVYPAGVSITDGGAFQAVSFATTDNQDGYVPAPTPSDYQRYWSVRMECIKPKGDLRLYDYRLNVHASREVNE